MRILVLSDSTMPTPMPGGHGLGRMTSIVAEGLLARGHDVVLIAKIGSRFPGALIMVDANGYDGEKAIAREALKLHKEWPADAILDNGHLHYLSRMLPRLPIVSVYHDIYEPTARCPVLLSAGQQALMPVAFETARIIPNALDPAVYEPSLAASDPPYALFMGALTDIKQPVLAIEACARRGLKLVMAGQPLRPLPLSPSSGVEFIGMVDGAIKAEWMRGARVFLQLGVGESFGLTTLEASLYGTPVVGWPMGGTLDLILYGVNGAFVSTLGGDPVQNVVDAIDRVWDIRRDTTRAYAETLCNPAAQLDAYEDALADCAKGEWW